MLPVNNQLSLSPPDTYTYLSNINNENSINSISQKIIELYSEINQSTVLFNKYMSLIVTVIPFLEKKFEFQSELKNLEFIREMIFNNNGQLKDLFANVDSKHLSSYKFILVQLEQIKKDSKINEIRESMHAFLITHLPGKNKNAYYCSYLTLMTNSEREEHLKQVEQRIINAPKNDGHKIQLKQVREYFSNLEKKAKKMKVDELLNSETASISTQSLDRIRIENLLS